MHQCRFFSPFPQSQCILCGCVQSEEDYRNILYKFLQWSVVLALLLK